MDRNKKCVELESKIKNGEIDEGLFEMVVECLGDELTQFAILKCGSVRSDAEDISQDALLAAKQYFSRFRGESSLRTWLYRLVVSACSRRRRGRKNDPNLHRTLEDEDGLNDRVNPELSLMISERLSALEEAIHTLDPDDRELLASVEWREQSLKEVASERKLTVPAIKSRLFRIRQKIRGHVESKFQPRL